MENLVVPRVYLVAVGLLLILCAADIATTDYFLSLGVAGARELNPAMQDHVGSIADQIDYKAGFIALLVAIVVIGGAGTDWFAKKYERARDQYAPRRLVDGIVKNGKTAMFSIVLVLYSTMPINNIYHILMVVLDFKAYW
jgi:hypothetical protein